MERLSIMSLTPVVLLAFVSFGGLPSVDGFCLRPYDHPDWKSKSLAERAEAVDIVVYGNVTVSPCKKPPPTTAPPTTKLSTPDSNSTAAPNNATTATPQTTAVPTTTSGSNSSQPHNISVIPSNSHNCSAGFYNITVEVFCVIKGGHLPQQLQLERFGLGEGMCVHENETVEQFHAYEGQNYVFFLGRHEEPRNGSSSFWLHTVNREPAAAEVTDEDMLEPIFAAAGKHAHAPLGVWDNMTHSICEPYTESGAGPGPVSTHVAIFLSLATLVSMALS